MQQIRKILKISLFPFNVIGRSSISRDSAITVQSYDYTMAREIDSYGMASGACSGSYLSLQVRVGTKEDIDWFYERLTKPDPNFFSLVFSPEYDDSGILSSSVGSLVVEGYIVDVEEIYDRNLSDSNDALQMLLNARVLVSNLRYDGENSNNLVKEF